MLRHYNITVKGLVQGVSYRFNTQAKAHELDLTGFVRNNPDRSVYIEAEGEENKIDQLIEWCYVGPRLAKVTEVIPVEGEWKGFQTFEVRK